MLAVYSVARYKKSINQSVNIRFVSKPAIMYFWKFLPCIIFLKNLQPSYVCIVQLVLLLLQPFNGLFSRTTWVSRYQKGKSNLDFTGARDSEWQWHQLDHMQVCTSLQTNNHASTPPLCFLQAGCPSCRPTNSVKALKADIVQLVASANHSS